MANPEGHVEDIESGEHQRRGTLWTVGASLITTMIGCGVLALPWCMSVLGWIGGPIALCVFASISYYTAGMLADCYRAPDPITGSRNRSYIDAVKSYLSPMEVKLCAFAQTASLWGAMVSYTVTSTISLNAISRSNCFHDKGHDAECQGIGPLLVIVFGFAQLLASQIPSLEDMRWFQCVAAAMSCTYSFVSVGLSFSKVVSHGYVRGGITGVTGLPPTKKAFLSLQALGNMCFAYAFAEILIETQDTLKAPPSENKTMKKATILGVSTTSILYLSIGCLGFAAFGNEVPGNILSGFGFFEPFWLVDIGNICVVIHLSGAYQMCAQPVFANLERLIVKIWPESNFVNLVYTYKVPYTASEWGILKFIPMRFTLRSAIVIITTLIAMAIPFFNSILGMLGAITFVPLTVYFPISMHIAQNKIGRGQRKWILLQLLKVLGFCISIAISIGSGAEIVHALKTTKLFKLV